MKSVITYILQEQDGKRFHLKVIAGKFVDPDTIIQKYVELKNEQLVEGETPVEVLKKRSKGMGVSFAHDWKKVGDHYVCVDCGTKGTRGNIFTPIKPVRTDEKFKDCSWKIKL